MKRRWAAVLSAILLIAAACGGGGDSEPSPAREAIVETTTTTTTVPPSTTSTPVYVNPGAVLVFTEQDIRALYNVFVPSPIPNGTPLDQVSLEWDTRQFNDYCAEASLVTSTEDEILIHALFQAFMSNQVPTGEEWDLWFAAWDWDGIFAAVDSVCVAAEYAPSQGGSGSGSQ